MLRVVLGRARSDTGWSGKISSLQFNSAPGAQESTRSREEVSAVLAVSRSHRGEEVDLEANGEPRILHLGREDGIGGTDEGRSTNEKIATQNSS